MKNQHFLMIRPYICGLIYRHLAPNSLNLLILTIKSAGNVAKLNSSQLWVGYSIVVLIGNERRMIPNRPQIDRGLIMDDGILMFVIAFIIAPILIWIATVIYG
jgi:hypothetical protein